MACRGLLGLGELGHYAASAKVVAEWLPPRGKAVAVGLYVMGGTLRAAVAAPLVVWLTRAGDRRTAFVVTGAAGLVLAVGYTLTDIAWTGLVFLAADAG